MNDKIKQETEEYLKTHKSCGLKQYFELFKKDLYDFVYKYTSNMIGDYSFSQRLYWTIHNMNNFPLCPICNKQNKRKIKFEYGYSDHYQYCSHKCSVKSDTTIQKRKQTNLEKYGVDTPVKNKDILNKIKNTCLQKYGTTCYLTSEDGHNKTIESNIKKYDNSHYMKSEEGRSKLRNIWNNRNQEEKNIIVSKIKNTKLTKYNDCNYNNEQKRNQTNLERYGTINPCQLQSIKEKISQSLKSVYLLRNKEIYLKSFNTRLVKYNKWCPEDFIDKCKNTSRNKYGVDFYSQTESWKKSVNDTCIQKYNSKYVCCGDSTIRSYIENAQRNKYDGLMYSQTQEYKDRMIEHNKKKYKVEWSLQNTQIRDKCKSTLVKEYGCDNYFKTDECKRKLILKKLNKTYDLMLLNHNVKPLFDRNYFIKNYDYKNDLEWECKHCHNKIIKKRSTSCSAINDYYVRCPVCFPDNNHSIAEKEIYNMVHSYYPDAVFGDKSVLNGKELDIYIPSKNIAIEYDGLYWHNNTSLNDNHNYHLNKTLQCEGKKIQLIHVFEDEYQFKHDIVISRLKSILGIHDNIIYARKCVIKEVSNDESAKFLIDNHIQGNCNSKYKVGLYYNNKLVSLMTFGFYREIMGRQKVDKEYELLRFCNKCNYHIPGAASKLFKYFIHKYNPKKIISYADRRWSDGKLYKALNFQYMGLSKPNYWYIIGNKRVYRYAYRKNVLEKKLKIFDENKTEIQNMLDNGYDRIFDCGNMFFVIKI